MACAACCGCLIRIPFIGNCFLRCAPQDVAGEAGVPMNSTISSTVKPPPSPGIKPMGGGAVVVATHAVPIAAQGTQPPSSPRVRKPQRGNNSFIGQEPDSDFDDILLTPRRRGVSFARIERCSAKPNTPDAEGNYAGIRKMESKYGPTGRIDDEDDML